MVLRGILRQSVGFVAALAAKRAGLQVATVGFLVTDAPTRKEEPRSRWKPELLRSFGGSTRSNTEGVKRGVRNGGRIDIGGSCI